MCILYMCILFIYYLYIYLSICYLYIIQGGERTGDARLRQHKLDEDEDEDEEDVYGNQQRQRRPALREEEDEKVYGNQVTYFTCCPGTKVEILTPEQPRDWKGDGLVLSLLALLVQKYKY